MDWLLTIAARGLVWLLQSLPLGWVVRLGRAGGTVAWWLDARHRRIALENLRQAFGNELSEDRIRALARENLRRLGENYVSAVKTAGMSAEALRPHLEIVGLENLAGAQPHPQPHPQSQSQSQGQGGRSNRIVAIGHFGNFELYARVAERGSGYRSATTYRGLPQPALNAMLQKVRGQSGCLFFERRQEGQALREAMGGQGLLLGLLADQHAGDHGLRLPFLGRECSTSAAPAVFARRYRCPLHVAICFRVRPGGWRIEISEALPLWDGGRPLGVEEIMREVNRRFETAIRRDPANWFWVHRRWKPAAPRRRSVPVVGTGALTAAGG